MEKLHLFSKDDLKGIELPKEFTFPFNYIPHQLSRVASNKLWYYLEHTDLKHNFWDVDAIGKMFGVLVVKTPEDQIGFLAAFSGKLGHRNDFSYFVPPVFDILTEQGFYKKEEKELIEITRKIEKLTAAKDYLKVREELSVAQKKSQKQLSELRTQIKSNKKNRKTLRETAETKLSEPEFNELLTCLKNESLDEQFPYRRLAKEWKLKIETLEEIIREKKKEIEDLKSFRKQKSNQLQQRLFEHYTFLNAEVKEKSLFSIFDKKIPPAGAGECAAPKLLQYAYLNKLYPLAMAEFWWGISPNSKIRTHKQFYPSCKSKCEPILKHMLKGLPVAPNPIHELSRKVKELKIEFEDEEIVVVNKPENFLSVPGKNNFDSIEAQLDNHVKGYSGPYLVHRLDFSTSGILLAAKTKTAHHNLQNQFADRSVKKRYVALLEKHPKEESGYIELPLRVDLDNRPQQLVCLEHGKPAKTFFKVTNSEKNKVRVMFSPITGRTHQLRVHAAHKDGLSTPIIGDELYGNPAERLYLHAEWIEFTHPSSEKRLQFKIPSNF